jgi:hypothetical protein
MPSTVAELERPSPGSWRPLDLELAGHEAGHAAVAVLLGLPLEEVRIDRPDVGLGGFARTGWVDGKDAIRRRLQVIMAGPLATVQTIPWPPSGDSVVGDERNAAVLRDGLHLDRVEWWLVEEETRDLLLSQRVAVRAVQDRLLEVGAILGDEVVRLVEETLMAKEAN